MSTKFIFNALFKPLLTSGQLQWFSSESNHSEGNGSINHSTTNTSISEEGHTEGILQLKINDPKLTPVLQDKLTSKEYQELMKEFILAKHMLYDFKETLRQKGFDVTNYFVSIHNGRIAYHIPNTEHYHFFMKNKYKFVDIREIEPSKRREMKM